MLHGGAGAFPADLHLIAQHIGAFVRTVDITAASRTQAVANGKKPGRHACYGNANRTGFERVEYEARLRRFAPNVKTLAHYDRRRAQLPTVGNTTTQMYNTAS